MFQVDELAPDDRRWQEALSRVEFYDAYHTPAYQRFCAAMDDGEPFAWLVEKEEQVLLFPSVKRRISDSEPVQFDLSSVYGYPGPVTNFRDDADRSHALNLLLARAKEEGYVSWVSRLHPLDDYAWLPTGGAVVRPVNKTVYIPLEQTDDEILAAMSSNHRRDIRKLLRNGATFKSLHGDQRLEEFTEFYHQTMRRQSAADSYFFSLAYFEALAESLGESFQMFSIQVDEQPIAMAIGFRTGRSLQYHLGAVPDEAVKQSGLKTLFFEIAKWGRDRGCQTLHLGGGLGGRDDDGLFRFKQGFSKTTGLFQVFQAVLREAEYERLVRLTGANQPAADGFFPRYRAPQL